MAEIAASGTGGRSAIRPAIFGLLVAGGVGAIGVRPNWDGRIAQGNFSAVPNEEGTSYEPQGIPHPSFGLAQTQTIFASPNTGAARVRSAVSPASRNPGDDIRSRVPARIPKFRTPASLANEQQLLASPLNELPAAEAAGSELAIASAKPAAQSSEEPIVGPSVTSIHGDNSTTPDLTKTDVRDPLADDHFSEALPEFQSSNVPQPSPAHKPSVEMLPAALQPDAAEARPITPPDPDSLPALRATALTDLDPVLVTSTSLGESPIVSPARYPEQPQAQMVGQRAALRPAQQRQPLTAPSASRKFGEPVARLCGANSSPTHCFTAHLGDQELGQLNVRIGSTNVVEFKLLDLLALVQTKMDAGTFERLASSSNADSYVPLVSLVDAGFGLDFDAQGNRLLIGGPEPDANAKHQVSRAIEVWNTVETNDNISAGGSLTYAPGGDVYGKGARVQLGVSYDRYYYPDWNGSRVAGGSQEFNLLIGVVSQQGPWQISMLAGPVMVRETSSASPDSALNTFGARMSTALALSLGSRTVFGVTGSYATVQNAYSAATSLRFPLNRELRLGAEATLGGNNSYWQVKIGPALSGISVAGIQFALSGGISFRNGGAQSAFFGLYAGTTF